MLTALSGEKVPLPSIAMVASEQLADAVQPLPVVVLAAPKEFGPSLSDRQVMSLWSSRAVATHVAFVEVLFVRVVDPVFGVEIGASEDEYSFVRVVMVIDGGVVADEIAVAVLAVVEFVA